MAYGKDPKNLGTGGSFRQQANRYQHQKDQNRKSRGGGGGAYWATQYKPSMDEPDTIRVIEGKYVVPQVVQKLTAEGKKEAVLEMIELPFFPFAEHYDGREKKTCICSAGPWAGSKDKAAPCVGCELFWSGMEKDHNGKKKQGRMSRREMYVFSVLDYGVYHNVEQVDFKTGQIRINEQTNQPWMHWVKCEGQGCEACRAGKETRRGMTRHWALGWGHYQSLLDADKKIGKSCSNCRATNSINCIAWTCPQCGDAIVDMASTTLKTKEIDDLVSNPVTCKCGFNGFAHEIIECRSCSPAGGTARRATIFDVDMNVNRVADPNGGNNTTLSISQWSAPGAVDPNFKEFHKSLDLEKIYTPTPIEKQRELFDVKGPIQRTPVTSGEAARPWQGQQAAPPMQQQMPPPPQMAAPPQNPYAAQPPAQQWQQPPPVQQWQPPPQTAVQPPQQFIPAPQPQFVPQGNFGLPGLPPPPDSQK
jgi:hypothetical protein